MVDGFGSGQDEKDGEYQRERVILAGIGGNSKEKGGWVFGLNIYSEFAEIGNIELTNTHKILLALAIDE